MANDLCLHNSSLSIDNNTWYYVDTRDSMTREQWKNRKVKQPSNHIWLKDKMTDKELWSGAFNAVAGAVGVKDPSIACNWADLALRYWREYKGEVRK